jgi:hypothetical protein
MRFHRAGVGAIWRPPPIGITIGDRIMRAETQSTVDQIRESLSLLRRHL